MAVLRKSLEESMFAVTGITGQVGGAIGKMLLRKNRRVRAVVRNASKGATWAEQGCEIAIAEIDDADALKKAFEGSEGMFLMTPPNFDPEPGFQQTHKAAAAIKSALLATRPGRVVYLSTVGAQVSEPNLLNNSKITEEMLRTLPVPVAFLRAAWFMENASWDVASARNGHIPSFLQPLDHAIPMVATQDIASAAVELLCDEPWQGVRTVELEGPRRYSANEIAGAFSRVLGHPVLTSAVPQETWEDLFRSQGMKHPMPRIRMLDGFNEGWIEFEGGQAGSLKGSTPLEAVVRSLVSPRPH
jgi:NAD(P)H dehydrogenase (quinone)